MLRKGCRRFIRPETLCISALREWTLKESLHWIQMLSLCFKENFIDICSSLQWISLSLKTACSFRLKGPFTCLALGLNRQIVLHLKSVSQLEPLKLTECLGICQINSWCAQFSSQITRTFAHPVFCDMPLYASTCWLIRPRSHAHTYINTVNM